MHLYIQGKVHPMMGQRSCYCGKIDQESHFNRTQYNKTCKHAKSEFLKAKIQDNHHDPKQLWQVLGDVSHRLPAKILPSIPSEHCICL